MSMNSEKLYSDIIPNTFNNRVYIFLKPFSKNFLGVVVEGEGLWKRQPFVF